MRASALVSWRCATLLFATMTASATLAIAQSPIEIPPSGRGFAVAEPATRGKGPDIPQVPRPVGEVPHKHGMPPLPIGQEAPGVRPPIWRQLEVPQGQPQGPGAPCDLIQRRNTSLVPTVIGGPRSTVGEPTMALMGTTDPNATLGFGTGNWHAEVGLFSGSSWLPVNPYTQFPAIDGGFCCDQVCRYVPRQDAMVWFLQYLYSATTQKGSVRIAYALGQAGVIGSSWSSYVFSPQTFGRPLGQWLDYPDVAISNSHIYFSSNIYTAAGGYVDAVVWAMPLSTFFTGSSSYARWNMSEHGGGGSVRFTQGEGVTMYGATHVSSTRLRILKWSGFSLSVIERDHASFAGGPTYISILANGTNWAGRLDTRISGAYQTPDEYGFLWTASQSSGGNLQPYTRWTRFRTADDTLISDENLSSNSVAFMYPAACGNDAGGVLITMAYGGPSNPPSAVVGKWLDGCPDGLQYFATGDADPALNNAWGDYQSVQRHPVRSLEFVVAGLGQIGGSAQSNTQPRWAWVGRERDNPAWMTVAVQSTPITGIPIACRYQTGGADNLGRTSVTTTGYASFNASTNYVLTAPTVHSAGGRLYRFKEWRFRTAPYGSPGFYSTFADTLFLADARDDVAVAVYDETRPIAIGSRNPTSGVAITVSPSDVQSNGNGTTSFTRHYVPGTNVTLTAPASIASGPFKRWWLGGVAQPLGTRTLAVSVAAGTTPIAVEAEYCTHTQGTITPFGTGCVGSNGLIPLHSSTSIPDAGTTVIYQVSNLPAVASASLWLGFSNTFWDGVPLPLSLGLFGADPSCNLLIGRFGSFGVSTGGGIGTSMVALPSWLPVGTDLYTQVLVVDFGVPSPLKLTVSNGLHTTTGGDDCN